MPTRAQFEKDYYGMLGIPSSATEADIRKAYRRLALQWHPDRNPGNPSASERFKEISEAYGVLIDSSKRLQYDQARQTGTAEGIRYTREDIFRDLFTNPRASAVFEELAREFERMGMRVDRHYFHQTLFGGRTVVSGGIFIVSPLTPIFGLFRLARNMLRGAGSTPPLGSASAPPLPGPAKILSGIANVGKWLLGLNDTASTSSVSVQRDLTQPLRLTRSEALHGGSKRVAVRVDEKIEEVLLTIPPGVETGTKLRLRGKGRAGPGNTRGDLYLAVEVLD